MKTKEELKSSYIRYSPEITEEVFKRIIDKVERLGFKQYLTYNDYEDFVSNNLVLRDDYTWFVINPKRMDNNRQEIEVSDILGDVKWSVGSYVVFCEDGGHGQPIGKIDKIVEDVGSFGCVELLDYSSCAIRREEEGQIKWFATLSEAEAFSKSLLGQREANEELFPEYGKPAIKKSKEFDRNWYVKVSSQEEANIVLDWLKNKGEETTTDFKFTENSWSKIWFCLNSNYRCYNTWCLGDSETLPTNLKEKQVSDIIPEYKQSSGCIFLESELEDVTVELIDVPDI